MSSGDLRPGDTAPDFALPNEAGHTVHLADEVGHGPVVLFFYPRAMTPGCTQESCHFRDLASEFAAAGARLIGISTDPVDRQHAFADKHGLGFPLLSDPDRAVAREYGVKRPGPLANRRTTFVIGRDRGIMEVIHSETNMAAHADRALLALSAPSPKS